MKSVAPAVLLIKMMAATPVVHKELEGHFRILGAQHAQAACRYLAEARPLLVIASELLPFYDVDVVRAHLPPDAVLRLASPELPASEISQLVRRVSRVLPLQRAASLS